jgi:kynureninase
VTAQELAVPRRLAEELDAQDPLAGVRDQFVVADPQMIYLDANSLGRLPAATPDFLDAMVRDSWGRGLVGSWQTWIDWANRVPLEKPSQLVRHHGEAVGIMSR